MDGFGRGLDRSGDHQANGSLEIGERVRVALLEVEAVRHKLNRARQFRRRHAVAQGDLARGVRALDRAGDQAEFAVDKGLMEVARLPLLLREQLLDLGRAP